MSTIETLTGTAEAATDQLLMVANDAIEAAYGASTDISNTKLIEADEIAHILHTAIEHLVTLTHLDLTGENNDY